MADEMTQSPRRVDRVGHTGIYPASGPRPPGEYMVRGQGELGHPEEHAALQASRRASWSGNTVMLMAGRIIVGGYFLYNGINHFRSRRMLADYARSKQVPAADAAVIGSGALAALGGLSILTGFQPRIGATMLSTFLLGVSQMHDFWNVEDPAQRQSEMVNFTKNMALVGATCFIASVPGPWPLNIRRRSEALVAA